MALSSVQINFLNGQIPPQTADTSGLQMVIGCTSSGTANVPTTITTSADLVPFGFGPAIEAAAEVLTVAGGPVYLTKAATSTPGAAGAVTKVPANAVGVSIPLPGEILLPGADKDGNVLFAAKQLGVTLTVSSGMTSGFTFSGSDVTLTVAAGAKGSDIAALVLSVGVAALINQPVALGSGGSACGTTLAKTAFDKGSLSIGPKVQNVRYKTVLPVGANAALGVSTSSGDITISLGTNADSQYDPTKNTATLVKAQLDASASALVATALVGDGSGSVGQQTTFQPLTFGSTGTLSVTGDANDRLNVHLQIARAGTVGVVPYPTLKFSLDTDDPSLPLADQVAARSYSVEVVIPPGGVVLLKDGAYDTGLTLTFSNAFDAGDTFDFSTTEPKFNATTLGGALSAAIGDGTRPWSFAQVAGACDSTLAAAVDAPLQAAKLNPINRYLYAFLNTRDPNVGESEDAWMAALQADFQNFTSKEGRIQVCAGSTRAYCSKARRVFKRYLNHSVAARKSAIPVHEDLGKVATGPLQNVLSTYHDESVKFGLNDSRFICTQTHLPRPGIYVCGGPPTMDLADSDYNTSQRVSVPMQAARIGYLSALRFLNDSETADAATGAISEEEANALSDALSQPVDTWLFSPKSDNKVSASRLPTGRKTVTVLRNYNFLGTSELRCVMLIAPLGYNKVIKINLGYFPVGKGV